MRRPPTEGRYSRVSRRIWNDEKFRRLSAAKPNAQTLWFRLLTGPELSRFPGLFAAFEGGLADALGWPVAAFRRCWKEIADSGMVCADWRAGLVWVPHAIRHNEPSSPNVVASWRAAIQALPECGLRDRACAELESYLTEMGPEWIGAWGLAEGVVSRPTKIPAEVRRQVQERDKSRCRYCGESVNWNDRRGPLGATYDHVDPAGSSDPSNLVISCRGCNSRKGFRTPEMAGMTLRPETGSGRDPEHDPDRNPGPDLGPGRKPSNNQEQDRGSGSGTGSDPTGVGGSGDLARGAREPATPSDPPLGEDLTDSERPSVCPLDLVQRAEKHGVIKLLSERLRETEADVRAGFEEFLTYWTIGEGAGKQRSHWMRKAREDVRQKHLRGQLTGRGKPLGLELHEATSADVRRVEQRIQAAKRRLERKREASGAER